MTAAAAYFASLLLWVMIHLVWQGALVGATAALLLRRTASPTLRHRISLLGLGLVVAVGVADAVTAHAALIEDASRLATRLSPVPEDSATLVGSAFRLAWSFREPLLWVWLAGSAWLMVSMVRGSRWVSKFESRCRPSSASARSRVRELAAQLALSSLPRIVDAPAGVEGPCVLGRGAGVLVLPGLLLPQDEWDALILHELAHLKRRDLTSELVLRAMSLLLWWNPAFGWLRAQLRHAREQCCDLEVIAQQHHPATLARALVRLEANRQAHRPILAAGGGDLTRRIVRLLSMQHGAPHSRTPPSGVTVRFVILFTAAAAIMWRSPADLAPQTDELAVQSALVGHARVHRTVISGNDPKGRFRLILINGRVASVSIPGAAHVRSLRSGSTVRITDQLGRSLLTFRLRPGGIEWRARAETALKSKRSAG